MLDIQKEYLIQSPEEMIQLGYDLTVLGYKRFGLKGLLGAGKTHFTKGVARALGMDESQVHSPTYVYFHRYESDGHVLLHVDMYRMTDPMLLVKSGLSDIMDETEYRTIERPKYEWIGTDDILMLQIDIIDSYTRKVVVG